MSLSRKLIFLYCFIYLFSGCGNTEKNFHHPLGSPPIPFYLDYDRLSVPTSDSLLANNKRAKMLVTIYQNRKAEVLGFKIDGFRLWKDEKLVCSFDGTYELNEPKSISEVKEKIHPKVYYPSELHPYYITLKNYLEDLKFTKATSVTPDEVNIASFVFRFEDKKYDK